MTLTNKQAAERLLELDKDALEGPWIVDNDIHDAYAHNLDGNPIAKTYAIGGKGAHKRNVAFIAESRTLAPQLAKAYLEAVELLKESEAWLAATSNSPYMTELAARIKEFLRRQG